MCCCWGCLLSFHYTSTTQPTATYGTAINGGCQNHLLRRSIPHCVSDRNSGTDNELAILPNLSTFSTANNLILATISNTNIDTGTTYLSHILGATSPQTRRAEPVNQSGLWSLVYYLEKDFHTRFSIGPRGHPEFANPHCATRTKPGQEYIHFDVSRRRDRPTGAPLNKGLRERTHT